MLRWRLLVAAVLIAPLIALLVLDFRCNGGAPGIWLAPLTLVFGLLGAAEMLDLFRGRQLSPSPTATLLGTLVVIAAALVPLVWNWFGEYPAACPIGQLGWPVIGLAPALTISMVAELARFQEPGRASVHLALSLYTAAYLGIVAFVFSKG